MYHIVQHLKASVNGSGAQMHLSWDILQHQLYTQRGTRVSSRVTHSQKSSHRQRVKGVQEASRINHHSLPLHAIIRNAQFQDKQTPEPENGKKIKGNDPEPCRSNTPPHTTSAQHSSRTTPLTRHHHRWQAEETRGHTLDSTTRNIIHNSHNIIHTTAENAAPPAPSGAHETQPTCTLRPMLQG
jgi:hypothetical protein